MNAGPTLGTCADCAWWTRQGPTLASAARDPSASSEEGSCGLFPPQVVRTAFGATSYFPVTHESRFCGDWAAIFEPDGDGGESEPVPTGNVIALDRRAA